MKKKIQKPFSLEAWKNGAKVETRDENKVRILCTDLNNDQPIVAVVTFKNDEEHVHTFDTYGHYYTGEQSYCDLVIVEEVEEPERWADDKEAKGEGWVIDDYSFINDGTFRLNNCFNFRAFATEKQAKSALAMARISQLMAHDERYGGVVTDEEWERPELAKCIIMRYNGRTIFNSATLTYHFLAFHTNEQRALFLAKNEQLVKDYLMID